MMDRYIETLWLFGVIDYSEMIHIITYTEAISGCEVDW